MTKARRDRGRHQVAVLARHGVMPMELGIVHQMFGAARDDKGNRLYEVRTCAPSAGTTRTDADFTINLDHGRELLVDADTVLVPASHELDETSRPLDEDTRQLLTCVFPRTRVASICTGAFALAYAGLLQGRRATTHWMSADRFRVLYPDVDLDPGVLFIDDTGVLTSAGEASGVDLCLHMLRVDHGAAVAADVARRTIVPPHREGGQAQYIPCPLPNSGVGATAAARAWALDHLSERIRLRDLAAQEQVSVRTFTRCFRAETGTSPGQWLSARRLDRARELLEQTDLSIDQVATAAWLRHRNVPASPPKRSVGHFTPGLPNHLQHTGELTTAGVCARSGSGLCPFPSQIVTDADCRGGQKAQGQGLSDRGRVGCGPDDRKEALARCEGQARAHEQQGRRQPPRGR
ncbi:MAG: GlxA family transcriptional regulator [Nocardioidaceae bacterium]